MGIVDTLWLLDLIAGRAEAVRAEFLLSGPVNLWLQGILPLKWEKPRIVMVTSKPYENDLAKAITIGSKPEPYPGDLNIERGLILHVSLRGASISLISDPVLLYNNNFIHVKVPDYSRKAKVIIINNKIIRLAPLSLEEMLWGE